jgi:hypothetical protein
MTVAAEATKAPAMIDGQEAADLAAKDPLSIATAVPAIIVVSSMAFSSSVRAHRKQENDRKRYTEQPKQYSATHDKPL